MKVCVASQFLSAGVGGISRVARLSFQTAVDDGYDVCGLAAEDTPASEGLPANVEAFSGSRLNFVLACQKAIIANKRLIYDFAGTARAHLLPLGALRSYAVWIHGIEVWEDLNTAKLQKIARAHTLFANSHYTKARAIALHGPVFEKAKVCWLGTLEDEPGVISPSRDNGPPNVLIVGRIEPGRDKGHDALIDAWPQVVSAVPEARLKIVGDGRRLDEIKAKIARSSAWQNIDVLGHVNEAALANHFASATAFAMPSLDEGFGLVYIEAMRYALPVITSTTDAGSEVNIDGETGHVVDMAHPSMLTERLIELLRDRDRAKVMGLAGLSRWRAEFSFSRFRHRFSPLLKDFVRSNYAAYLIFFVMLCDFFEDMSESVSLVKSFYDRVA